MTNKDLLYLAHAKLVGGYALTNEEGIALLAIAESLEAQLEEQASWVLQLRQEARC